MEDVPAFKYPKHTSNRNRHLVEDAGIAKAYLKYWTLLRNDPERSVARDAVMDLTPNPTDTPATCVFSPRSSAAMRKWYGPRIRNARNCGLFTGAFGIDPVLLEALADKGPALHFILLERPPNAAIKAARKKNPGDILLSHGAVLGRRQGRDENGKPTKKLVPIPNFKLEEWFLDEDLERQTGEGFVFIVHAKFLLIEPPTRYGRFCPPPTMTVVGQIQPAQSGPQDDRSAPHSRRERERSGRRLRLMRGYPVLYNSGGSALPASAKL